MISVSSEAINELARTFFRIPQLPQLETINLKFNPVDDNQTNSDGEDRLSLQSSTLGILHASFSVRGPSKLKSLSLLNIRASNPSPLEILQLQNIFPSLQCLQLSAVSDKAPNSDTFRNRWRYFWRTLRSCMVPIQTQIILTELTLHSDRLLVASTRCPSVSCTFRIWLCSPYAISSSIQSETTSSSSSGMPPLFFGLNSSLARCLLVSTDTQPQPNQYI